ncbi:hypothetical protein J5N97_018509 [Dioscorea zingiberensis]|uniref:HEAT repeat-containing protein 1 n=1 Tax=Dioscorea zingiberensis TaxID=325984 RepID=A0A9D5CD57_9LILI|nr:hypothetical protein J5N97_018509 [Dioscorea zingiberensis]
MAISSGSLRATGALICVLGSKALSLLPHVMKNMLQRAHEVSTCPLGRSGVDCKMSGLPNFKVSILNSILVTLKAIIESLGRFLNPYLEDVLDIMVLHPEYALDSDTKIKSNASTVRKLLTEKIPVRVMLTPLLKIYASALKCGEFSLTLEFEMLANMISSMDRSSIASYDAKIFEQCILALDLRHQLPESIKDVNIKVLLKPIVSQFVVESPTSFEPSSDAPSVEEVNELIVVCLGQMAVTSRSDVLWQPLNHEVLMQTRSEKVRARILGLRVVDYLLDHLKEEYLSLMAQTVPFLAELLEDVESSVKSLSQEIVKKMETLSGENIRQYL